MDLFPSLADKRLVITGVNGFVGAHTAVVALKTGARVSGVDLPGSAERGNRVRRSLGGGEIPVSERNLTDTEAWRDVLEQTLPDAVLHLAGATGRGFARGDWAANIAANVLTTSCMVEAILSLPEAERPAVVHAGSQMEYGAAPMPWTEDVRCRPTHPYGASKLAATELLLSTERAGQLRACVGRFAILYGPGQPPTMFIAELTTKALAGVNFPMTEGRQRRRFLYVADAAGLLLHLAARLLGEETLPPVLNMPASAPTSMREVARAVVDCLDRPVVLEIGALPARGDELLEAWPEDTAARSLGFSNPTTLEEGLRQTVAWYEENSWFSEAATA